MAIEKIKISRFLELGKNCPVLDVRSPGEFHHAHIPGAVNMPLFSDEERRQVGTAYKQKSREMAIRIGLDYFGPKMRTMTEFVESLIGSGSGQVLVHCWRGGMRSEAVAWLLNLYGFRVYTLLGGYKAYRHWIIESFSLPFRLQILGGFSGSGKTEILRQLKRRNEHVIDLEELAHHKGSAFGNIGMPPQPGQEMFENKLGHALRTIQQKDGFFQEPLWLEDESQRIGPVNIPKIFWERMVLSPVYFIDVPFEIRLRRIVHEYGNLDRERMSNAITRIKKRLGGLETRSALEHLAQGNMEACFRILLAYYDKFYRKSFEKHTNANAAVIRFNCDSMDCALMADQLLSKEIFAK